MEWLLIGAAMVAVVIALGIRLNRKRAREDALLSPEERLKKRTLEEMADRMHPP
jgi:hypothetical protein